jgi:hypothetical protein
MRIFGMNKERLKKIYEKTTSKHEAVMGVVDGEMI